MTPNATPFLAPPEGFGDFDTARAVVVPFPYEGGVSYGTGTADGPQAVLEASQQVEFYDEELAAEPYHAGIATLAAPAMPSEPEEMIALLARITDNLLDRDKFPVIIGGDHSISSASIGSAFKRLPQLGVIQFDAHADLRDTYDGSPLSHACIMARVRERTPHTLQLGIRSMDIEEARLIRRENLAVATMRHLRRGTFDVRAALAGLPEHVFVTVDVDVFDWNVIASTGTPEPGGLGWYEALDLLRMIFDTKNVVGCDVVELSCRPHDANSPFAVAKLIHKMIGYKFASILPSA